MTRKPPQNDAGLVVSFPSTVAEDLDGWYIWYYVPDVKIGITRIQCPTARYFQHAKIPPVYAKSCDPWKDLKLIPSVKLTNHNKSPLEMDAW